MGRHARKRAAYLIARIVFAVLAPSLAFNAMAASLQAITSSGTPAHTVVDLHLSGKTRYGAFVLKHPDRAVIDLTHTKSVHPLKAQSAGEIDDARVGVRHGDDLRVVLDLSGPTRMSTHWADDDGGVSGRDLVVVLDDPGGSQTITRSAKRHARAVTEKRTAVRATPRGGVLKVMIDPGHGGNDPGTTGEHGLHEKTITLAVARRVAELIDAHPGTEAILTRKGDYYVSLAKRVEDAERDHADLFVSIHANAFPSSPAVDGGAVYMLSDHGASNSEARAIARAENADDPTTASGLPLTGSDQSLDSILVDLFQHSAMQASYSLAHQILHQLGRIEPLYEHHVQRANFEVLRDPAVPAVLVETAFLSNPHQAAELHHARFRDHLARAIADGIFSYLKSYRPMQIQPGGPNPGHYQVRRGDTLSGIAARVGASVERLRRYNHLHSNVLQVGQTLKVPPSEG